MDALRVRVRSINKSRLLVCIVGAFLVALLIATILGRSKYAPKNSGISIPPVRGEPRRLRRQSSTDGTKISTSAELASKQQNVKDPFANRPRLQTRNGHLVIESSRDKNIEFRTNGARGSITLNGFKMDQLFGVVKAIERSRPLTGNLGKSGESSTNMWSDLTDPTSDHYDAIVRNLLTSGQRLALLERLNSELRTNLTTVSKRLRKLGKRFSERTNQLKGVSAKLDKIETKLRQNNCFDSSGQPVCKNGATCIDNFDSFKCLCPSQYEGSTCEQDVDECAKYRGTDLGCQNGAKCNNFPGGYSCECPPQYHGVHCTEKHDDCALSSSATLCGHGKCVNLARTVPNQAHYECICDQGWTTDPSSSSPACVVDINECLAGSTNETTSTGAYPCSQNPFVECINLPGSFQCAPCPPGFTGNGRVCRDVDECSKNNGGCSTNPMVECINTFGSRRCASCPPGFVGDGVECKQASICTKEPNGGCHPNAKCLELAAVSAGFNRLCVCQYPFIGIGVGPQGCHLVGSSPMEKSMQVSNATSAVLDRPQDDCKPNPCLNGAECRRTDSSFECICPSGFTGHLCDQFADLTCGGALPASEGLFAFPVGGSYAKLIELMKEVEPQSSGSIVPATLPDGQRHYKCLWTIVAAKSNMSLKLTFSQLADKLNPSKPVQVWLAASSVGTTSGRGQANPIVEPNPPSCSERLDVRERLEPELVAAGAERRLMARLCSKGSSTGGGTSGSSSLLASKSLGSGNSNVSLTIDASAVDLEYSFSATRTQFGEPSLGFTVHWAQVEPTCGGQLPVAESGSLASPQFPEFYSPGIECRYLLRVPPNKRMRIQFGELTLRTILTHGPNSNCADSLTLLDGAIGSDRPVLLRHCANNITQSERLRASSGTTMQPIVSSSSTVELVLRSETHSTTPLLRPRQQKGFYLTYSSEPTTPGCGGLYTAKQATIVSDDYEPSKSVRDKSQRELAMSITSYFMNQQQQQQLRRAQKSSRAQSQVKPTDTVSDVLNEPDLSQAWQATRSSTLWQQQFNGLRRRRRQASPEKPPVSSSDATRWLIFRTLVGNSLLIPEGGTYAKRCEYEIRPENQRRNYRIQIDLIDMLGVNLDSTTRLHKYARRNRCAYTRLSIYDGVPSTTGPPVAEAGSSNVTNEASTIATTFNEATSNVNLLARFCGTDLYDSKQMQPIVSSGHVLYVVYETRQLVAKPSDDPMVQMDPTASLPVGFKLRYSTICSGSYRQLSGEIQTELGEFVTDCVYHIALPPNNTISLSIEPKDGVAGEQAMTLPDGSCAVQAMFVDGTVQRGWSAPEQRQELTLSFPVGSSGVPSLSSSEMKANVVDDVPFVADDQSVSASSSDQATASSLQRPASASRGDDFMADSDSGASATGTGQKFTKYWQYASSPVQDVKLFDVCHVQALTFDSTWNHVSLRFRLVDSARLRAGLEGAALEGSSTGETTDSNRSLGQLQLIIRYQSESACGGIISWPPNGTIRLIGSESVQKIDKYPLTIGRWEQLHRREFVNQCAWILRNKHNQAIVIKFDAPVDEIRSRRSDWFEWKRRSLKANKSDSANPQYSASALNDISFNCSEAFMETIELYEPSLNRSRFLCPTDLITDRLASNTVSSVAATTINTWTTQSDTVYIRLHNTSVLASNLTASQKTGIFPKKPLKGVISLTYTLSEMFVAANCGGRVLQDSGVIRSPRWPFKYPENSDCVWIIETGKQQQIRLNFTEFELEEQIVCQFDYLELRNGPTNESPLIGRFCGNQLKSRILITQSSLLWVRFVSDGHLSRNGFEMHFDGAQTGCGGVLSGASGQLDSPNYPYAYAHSADCDWTIQVSQSNRIRLSVIDLDLSSLTSTGDDSASNCTLAGPDASYIEVFDSTSSERSSKSLGRFCHINQLMRPASKFNVTSKSPSTGNGPSASLALNLPELVSSSNKLFISYKSQALDVGRGFRMSYTAECKEIELMGTQGAIESPGYPSGYSSNQRCSWLIKAPAGSNITFIVADLDLEDFSSRSQQSLRYDSMTMFAQSTRLGAAAEEPQLGANERQCNEDFVEISPDFGIAQQSPNGTAKAAPRSKGATKLCGRLEELSDQERSFEIPSNRARVVFRSDSSLNLHGFRLEWQAHGCGGQQVGGEFIRPIEFSEVLNLTRYKSNENLLATGIECLWTIDMSRNPQMRSLELQVNSDLRSSTNSQVSSTSGNADNAACEMASLTIFDGLDDKGPVLLQGCDGSFRVRETLLTSGGQVTIRYFAKPSRAALGSKSQVQFGTRTFQIQAWPASRESCMLNAFDVAAPYNQLAGSQKSPGYPDLYPAKDIRCSGLVTAQTGRTRFVVDELDIPSPKAPSTDRLLSDEECQASGNYLLLRSIVHRNNDKYLCGKLEARTGENRKQIEYVSDYQGAWIDFMTRGSLQGRWKVSYFRLCGSSTTVESTKDFITPNYPNRPDWISSNSANDDSLNDQVCIWRIKTSPNPKLGDRRIHLHVINFVESNNNKDGTDCLRVYEDSSVSLSTSSYNLTDIDSGNYAKHQVIKLCKQSDMKHSSLQYMSKGTELTLIISGNTIAKVRADVFDNYCGADFSHDRAEFASPNFPLAYGPDLDCHYFISGPPGSHISLKFASFELPDAALGYQLEERSDQTKPSCDNVDYIEIRSLVPRQRLIKTLTKLNQRSRNNRFVPWRTIPKPKSAKSTSTSTTTSTTTTTPTPKFNSSTTQTQANSTAFSSIANRFDLLGKLDLIYREQTSSYDDEFKRAPPVLALDEFYESSVLLGRFCGRTAPKLSVKQLNEQILVRLRSHSLNSDATRSLSSRGSKQARGFLASYQIEYGGLIKVEPPEEIPKATTPRDESTGDTDAATGDFESEPFEAVGGGLIASPMFPTLTRRNETIKWTFETRSDSVLQFEVVSMQIGRVHQDCIDDSLSIFDGLNGANSVRLAKLCGQLKYNENSNSLFGRSQRLPALDGARPQRRDVQLRAPIYMAHEPLVRSALIKQIRTTSNVASVVYDNFKTESMFLLRYSAISRATLLNESDTISESVVLHEEFDLAAESREESTDNQQQSSDKTCSAIYELSYAGGGNMSSVSLSSPAVSSPKDIIECHWLVYTRENNQLKFSVDATHSSVSYMEPEATGSEPGDAPYIPPGGSQSKRYDYCFDRNFKGALRQYIIVHDGATQLAPQIARYCLPAPPITLASTGRHLLIRYIQVSTSAVIAQKSLGDLKSKQPVARNVMPFKARVELDKCGGQYHVISATRLRDRYDSSKNYSNYVDCTYYLFASSTDKVLIILNQMSEFELASTPTNANCTVGDYIEIRDMPIRSGSSMDYSNTMMGRSLGRYCAGRRLSYIESPGTALAIHFHTDSAITAKGFELYVMSTQPRQTCPRSYQTLHADQPFGLLMSPNWPHGFTGKRHCKYQLVAPMESSIELTFVRYKRQKAQNDTCIDKLTYLADNEASSLRFDTRPLAGLMSPISGSQLRQLVGELPCKPSSKPLTGYKFRDWNNPTLLSQTDTSTGDTSSSPVQSFDTISAEEYSRLIDNTPPDPLTLHSNGSHVLMLDYETSGRELAPDEGFLAVYRLIDDELLYESLATKASNQSSTSGLSAGYRCGRSVVTAGSMLKSGMFGVPMREEDPYVQCEWNLKLSSSSSGSMGSASDMYYALSIADQNVNKRNSSSSNSSQVSEFVLTRADSIGSFTTSFIVFQVLELPSAQSTPYLEERWSADRYATSNDACGLNRLIVSDVYSFGAFFACGNLTNSYKWLLLDEPSVTRVSVRTKNLRLKQPNVGSSDGADVFYRGVQSYFHEKECLQIERLVSESVRIRSHSSFNLPATNDSIDVRRGDYQPGICRWQLQLKPGRYELTFADVHFRPPATASIQADDARNSSNCSNNTDDYLEIRASSGPFAPILERYCYMNERSLENNTSKQLTLNTTGELTLLFVAGLDELSKGRIEFEPRKRSQAQPNTQFGFDVRIRRVQNSTISDFCKPYTMNNIYTFIRSADFNDGSVYALSRSLHSFLYPKNTHCTVDLVTDEDLRFNITFKGIFDIEPSKDCQHDYLQLDDLIVTTGTDNPIIPTTTTAPNRPTTTNPKSKAVTSSSKTATTTLASTARASEMKLYQRFETRPIKKLCGRDRPKESFLSAGNKVRITFHSDNNSIVGKGFLLEYSAVSA